MPDGSEGRKKLDPWCLPHATIVDSGVDYLTVTASDAANAKTLWALGYGLMQEERSLDQDPRPFNWLGFEGLSCGGVTIAERDGMVLLRLSGGLAKDHWQQAARLAGNCSRLDLQVTARLAEPQPNLAEACFVFAAAAANLRGKQLKVQLISENGPGSTLYLGKRANQHFARLYNKEAESGDVAFRNCWRYEVELKGARSSAALPFLLREDDSESFVQAAVLEHFVKRGVACPWHPQRPVGLPCPPTRQSDDERRMHWLSSQVAPVVGKLLARQSRKKVIRSLGLEDD